MSCESLLGPVLKHKIFKLYTKFPQLFYYILLYLNLLYFLCVCLCVLSLDLPYYIVELLEEMVWVTICNLFVCRWYAHSIFYLSSFLIFLVSPWYLLSICGLYWLLLLCSFGVDPSLSVSFMVAIWYALELGLILDLLYFILSLLLFRDRYFYFSLLTMY